MAAQFDVYTMAGGQRVVVLQSDLLSQLSTRVVAPLIPEKTVGRVLTTLNPVVTLGTERLVLMPQLAATLALAEMGRRTGSLALMHDQIVRAMDALLSGI